VGQRGRGAGGEDDEVEERGRKKEEGGEGSRGGSRVPGGKGVRAREEGTRKRDTLGQRSRHRSRRRGYVHICKYT